MFHRLVIGKPDLSNEIKSQERKYHNPDCKIYFSVEYAPVVCLVCDAEELKTEGKFHKTENHLYGVEPASSAFLELLQEGRREG